MDDAVEAALGRVEAALARAREVPSPPAPFDACWLHTMLDEWLLMPEKVRQASTVAQPHVAVHWEQDFSLWRYPRARVPTLESLFALFAQGARAPDGDDHLRERGRRLSRETAADRREHWRAFLATQRVTLLEGVPYVELADLLRDGCCAWSGHWLFEGVVLDRYKGQQLDFEHYFRSEFTAPASAERLAALRDELTEKGLTGDGFWSLFSPSGETIWRLAHVFVFDGNTQSVLLEGEHEFLEVQAMGS